MTLLDVVCRCCKPKVQREFGGTNAYVPVGDDEVLAARNKRIRAERIRSKNPASIQDLMKKYSLSKRQIWTILGASD